MLGFRHNTHRDTGRIRALSNRLKWMAVCFALAVPLPLCGQQLVAGAPRAEITLNGMWDYVLNQSGDKIPSSGWKARRIPELPLADGTTSVWYRKKIHVRSQWVKSGRSFFLELDKAGHYAAVYWNGQFIGDHYGQYDPLEVEVTSALLSGQDNEIAIYVHQANSRYARRGVVLDQSSCPRKNPDCMANAYRPAAPDVVQRNWVGMVGDITFSWRPKEHISDVAVVSSVRNATLQAEVRVRRAQSGVTRARATVLDGSTPVLSLPIQTVQSGKVLLQASWTNPILWGPPPYGQPKLYSLRTELIENGKTIDVIYTRFGFREVWIEGRDVFLNGQKLWMAGDYFPKLSPIRYVNDRRPQAFLLFLMESSGLNTLQSHWDDVGRPWLELADEMGILVVGSFFCDGRPDIQSQADDVSAWTDWMAETARRWVRDRRNHPSIVIWRPADVPPVNVPNNVLWPRLATAVRKEDPSGRPIADRSDMDAWSQGWSNPNDPNKCDDGSAFAEKLANETKPLLVKEMYGNYALPCLSAYFDKFYRLDYQGGGVGLIPQHMKVFEPQNFDPAWFSISGRGNRPSSSNSLPNWIKRQWLPSNWSTQFADLYQTYVGPELPKSSPTRGEYQASGLPAGAGSAFLVSSEGTTNPIGVVIAADGSGTAWFDVPEPGKYKLVYRYGNQDVVQDVTVNAPPPFGKPQ